MNTSSEDKEVTRELWQARLPVCFQLSDDDQSRINRTESIEPLYLMLSRQLYFPCIVEKLVRYYSNYFKENANDPNSILNPNNVWLEYENTPLKWHYPIGVLYDLYTSSIESNSTITNSHLPWQIIVHLNNFPEDEVLRFPDKESIEAHYMSTIKEADALKHRSQIIGDMQKRDHKQLWNSLTQDRYEPFWAINQRLMSYTDNLQSFRYIPFRIHMMDKPFLQKLFCPYNAEENKWMTLKDLLQHSIEHELNFEQASNPRNALHKNIDDYEILIHGIQPSLNTPVQWLSEYFSYPDNFLHICLIEKNH